MEKRKLTPIEIKSIETQEPSELERVLDEDNLDTVFNYIKTQLIMNPDLYYVERIGEAVVVRKKVDKSIFYHTEDPEEMEFLLDNGLTKK